MLASYWPTFPHSGLRTIDSFGLKGTELAEMCPVLNRIWQVLRLLSSGYADDLDL
jgi:hypothetical protein